MLIKLPRSLNPSMHVEVSGVRSICVTRTQNTLNDQWSVIISCEFNSLTVVFSDEQSASEWADECVKLVNAASQAHAVEFRAEGNVVVVDGKRYVEEGLALAEGKPPGIPMWRTSFREFAEQYRKEHPPTLRELPQNPLGGGGSDYDEEGGQAGWAGSPPKSPWHPIATAPKDGTWMLLFSPTFLDHPHHTLFSVAYCHPEEKVFKDCFDMAIHEEPTHWMPLPAPPDTEKP